MVSNVWTQGRVAMSARAATPNSLGLLDDPAARQILEFDVRELSRRKPCPKCGTHVHVRKAQCECGHKFVVQKTKSGFGNDDE